uniref:alpha-1,6-glucosidase domain-containing protein n=1 Tax=Paraglaciecola sp. TaxID=1920173 RepID=UPI0030F4B091
DIEFASEVFNEMLSIRSTSALFRLTTGTDVIDRVGFHNIGKRQTQGLIVMSIDDGISVDETMPRADLDPMVDAIVVVVNSSYVEQSHTVATASGFELHAIQAMSVDPTVRGAYFSEGEGEGTFTVPALTTAVFVKNQSGAQGMGLSSYATSGAPDVVPFGDTTVFVRGGMNGWGEGNPMTYVGNGVYESVITVVAGDYEFKVASADWSTVDFGSSQQVVTLDQEKVLSRGGSNLKLTLAEDATLKFSVDASDINAPIFTVEYEEPFYPTTVYVRGGMNGWGEANPLNYLVGGQYMTTIDIAAGSYEFKIASADWSTVDYGSADADGSTAIGNVKDAGISGNNLAITIPVDGSYTFLFNVADINAPTISVFKAQMFGDTTVFVRGSINGWGEADPLVYIGNSTYEALIDIDAGDYEFKIASADWSTVDFGNLAGDVAVTLGTSKGLGRSGANFILSIVNSGTYKFTVSGPDPSAPKVTVIEVTP